LVNAHREGRALGERAFSEAFARGNGVSAAVTEAHFGQGNALRLFLHE
jgi:hypothetical protein